MAKDFSLGGIADAVAGMGQDDKDTTTPKYPVRPRPPRDLSNPAAGLLDVSGAAPGAGPQLGASTGISNKTTDYYQPRPVNPARGLLDSGQPASPPADYYPGRHGEPGRVQPGSDASAIQSVGKLTGDQLVGEHDRLLQQNPNIVRNPSYRDLEIKVHATRATQADPDFSQGVKDVLAKPEGPERDKALEQLVSDNPAMLKKLGMPALRAMVNHSSSEFSRRQAQDLAAEHYDTSRSDKADALARSETKDEAVRQRQFAGDTDKRIHLEIARGNVAGAQAALDEHQANPTMRDKLGPEAQAFKWAVENNVDPLKTKPIKEIPWSQQQAWAGTDGKPSGSSAVGIIYGYIEDDVGRYGETTHAKIPGMVDRDGTGMDQAWSQFRKGYLAAHTKDDPAKALDDAAHLFYRAVVKSRNIFHENKLREMSDFDGLFAEQAAQPVAPVVPHSEGDQVPPIESLQPGHVHTHADGRKGIWRDDGKGTRGWEVQ